MKITKLALLVALLMGAGPSYAGFVDNRITDGVIEVSYKSITLEDLVADIAPREYQVEYSTPEQRKTQVKISGKGTWSQLLSQATATSRLLVRIDNGAQRIAFIERLAEPATADTIAGRPAAGATDTSLANRPAGAAAPAPATSAGSAPVAAASRSAVASARTAALTPVATFAAPSFTTTSSDFQVSAVLQRWAIQSNMQFIWEPRNVEFQISAENDWGPDLRQAVRGLLVSAQANQSAQAGRERVRACIHPNKPKNVLRIIRFDERCEGGM